jgi:hypothetical protein
MYETIIGVQYKVGTKSHTRAVQQKKYFQDLLSSEL